MKPYAHFFPIMAHSFPISFHLLTEAFVTHKPVELAADLRDPSKILVGQKGQYANPDFIRQQ